MRRIVNVTHMSLDGLTNQMDLWHFDYTDDELNRLTAEQLAASDAMLMGRLTYDSFAEAWPARAGDPVADSFNATKKYVLSTTLETAEWNNSTVIKGDVVDEVTKIKQQPGKDILMYGYGSVAHTLMQHGLLDELQIAINPVLAGTGAVGDMLFRDGNLVRLEPTATRTLSSGLVIISYRLAQ